MESKNGIDAQAGTIVQGSRAAYEHLAAKFGSRFTALHKLPTFIRRCDLCQVPHMYQATPRGRKAFASWALEKWFLSGFTDDQYSNQGAK